MLQRLFFAALLPALACACAAFGAEQQKTETGSSIGKDEAKAFVDFHNDKRAEVKVAPVVWSADLAAFAQEWANQLAATGELGHRPGTGPFKQKYGENIYFNSRAVPAVEAAKSWYLEKKAYDAGKPKLPDSFLGVAHYTQMVWKGTTKIGAGSAAIKQGKLKGWTIIVCNYDPPGNRRGQKPYE